MSSDSPLTVDSSVAKNEFRQRRLTYAFAAGIFSKALAVAVQWFALPIALHALGTGRYAAFLALQSLVAWSGLLASGLVPSLPRFIAAAVVSGDRVMERNIFETVIIYLVTVSVLFALAMLGLGALVSPAHLVGARGIADGEIATAFTMVVLTTCAQFIGAIMPSIRSGYQELHYSFVWATLASLTVLSGLLFGRTGQPNIATFVLVIYLPLAICMILDMLLIVRERPYLVQGQPELRKTAALLAPQAKNALAGQLSYFLVSFLPTLIVAHESTAQETAGFGSIMQLLILACSGMNVIFQPLLPALANAYAHHDRDWLLLAYKRVAVLVGAICLTGLVVDILAGSTLIHWWLGPHIAIPSALPILLGVYFCLWIVSVMNFNVLAATGHLHRAGRAYLIEASIAVSLGIVLTHFCGSVGMASSLVIATASVTFWYLMRQVWLNVLRPFWLHSKI